MSHPPTPLPQEPIAHAHELFQAQAAEIRRLRARVEELESVCNKVWERYLAFGPVGHLYLSAQGELFADALEVMRVVHSPHKSVT